MDAWRYGIYLLVFTFDISLVRYAHSISMWTLEDEFHISARPCIILYVMNNNTQGRLLSKNVTVPRSKLSSKHAICKQFSAIQAALFQFYVYDTTRSTVQGTLSRQLCLSIGQDRVQIMTEYLLKEIR